MKRALTCGLLAVLWLAARPFAGQQAPPGRGPAASPSYRAPRLDGHPDLNGIWQAFVTANRRARASSRAARFRISRGPWRRKRRTSTSG